MTYLNVNELKLKSYLIRMNVEIANYRMWQILEYDVISLLAAGEVSTYF